MGSSLEIWWDGDEVFYPCTVTGYDEAAGTHQLLYDDGESDELDLAKEKYNLTGSSTVHPSLRRPCAYARARVICLHTTLQTTVSDGYLSVRHS